MADIDEPAVAVVQPPVTGPTLAPQPTPALAEGEVLTGLAGSGCSVGPVGKIGSVDPTLTTFMGLSMFVMAWRAIRRKVRITTKR